MKNTIALLNMTNCFEHLASISNNSVFVIQFHTNYVRINDNQIRVLDILRNRMSHFSGNAYLTYQTTYVVYVQRT